tara:strand:- start:36829 stop:38424 length:1596 start_codon:yes stop_codon:yes gene_type:complete
VRQHSCLSRFRRNYHISGDITVSIKSVIPRILKVNVPEVATKLLKFRYAGGRKTMTLSSNLLPLLGFHGDAKVVEESLGANQGYRVRLATDSDKKVKQVYLREYKSRSANPLKRDAKRVEQLIETSSKKIIGESMGNAEYAHITLRYGEITFAPVTSAERTLLQSLDQDDMINTLVAMTGGVDCSVLEQGGFRVDTVVEYRPQEKRDTTDYTEMTSLSVLANCAPRVLCNEDIYKLDPKRLAELVGDTPITVAHMSLQCDDFSTLKTNKQKSTSVDDLSSTLDMFIPALNIVDALKIPVLVVENVPGFLSSPINDVFVLQLKRRGYRVEQGVFDAREYGGHTSRKRLYMVATSLNAPFSFPAATAKSQQSVWQDVIEPHLSEIMMHDITDTKVMRDAVKTGRLRVITKDKVHAPTLTKAQGQDTKDSVVVEHEGRYFRLPLSVQRELNALPEGFDTDWMPKDKAAQLIGQSICCKLHHAIMASVKHHLDHFRSKLTRKVASVAPVKPANKPLVDNILAKRENDLARFAFQL